MADREVKLYVKATKTGQVKVTVNPWRRHVDPGDQVVFSPSGAITRYEVIWHIRQSPFTGGTTSLSSGGGKQKKRTRMVSQAATTGDVYQYSVTMYFTDPDGNERVATVDPDMVID